MPKQYTVLYRTSTNARMKFECMAMDAYDARLACFEMTGCKPNAITHILQGADYQW